MVKILLWHLKKLHQYNTTVYKLIRNLASRVDHFIYYVMLVQRVSLYKIIYSPCCEEWRPTTARLLQSAHPNLKVWCLLRGDERPLCAERVAWRALAGAPRESIRPPRFPLSPPGLSASPSDLTTLTDHLPLIYVHVSAESLTEQKLSLFMIARKLRFTVSHV